MRLKQINTNRIAEPLTPVDLLVAIAILGYPSKTQPADNGYNGNAAFWWGTKDGRLELDQPQSNS